MKLCILSMQKIQNFGSLLQSYALKKMLEQLGHQVSFIDIEKKEEDAALLGAKTLNFSNESEPKGILGKLKKIDRYSINRLRIKRRAWEQDQEFNRFRKNVLCVKQEDNDSIYDICVIGSDEVFSCLSESAWGFTSQLFGNVKQANQVITYAASCGATTYSEVPKPVRNRICGAFKNISAFSVRDANTAEFVKNLTGKSCELNLDPVAVYDFSQEIDMCNISDKMPQRCCIIYSYYNRIHTRNEIMQITNFCKKNELTPVTVGAPQMWIKTHLVLSPFEALAAFKDADFIITDTFHGTIFSAKFAKRFAVKIRPSNQNKLSDLVERLGIRAHVVDSMGDLERAYSIMKDSDAMNELIQVQRMRTQDYLKASTHRNASE